jgi:hypothetical protein
MSKRITTRWYIGAWVVWLLALVVFLMTANKGATGTSAYAIGTSPISIVAWLVAVAAGIVMLVMWIGALIRMGQLASWGWFAAVLILHLIGLGIIGMVAYAAAGPGDREIAVRPTAT